MVLKTVFALAIALIAVLVCFIAYLISYIESRFVALAAWVVFMLVIVFAAFLFSNSGPRRF